MSRVAKRPVELNKDTSVTISEGVLAAKGKLGELVLEIHPLVDIIQEESSLLVKAKDESVEAKALSGTFRALVSNVIEGVSNGFQKSMTLVGVGYRAQAQGNKLNLTLGFSHPVEFDIPEGITIETPSQTELLIKGIDKQKVGQVAANIRKFRPPEPYKGKGIRFTNERIVLKEAKKN
ncbi:MAG: 50S ribosomal protein L6 [Proteobacteria bacterium]|jgi:large subunit ribosomal protein L6|nr:50S ribosomal protein L6 [Pseudomonadota bacterium]